MFQDLTTWAKYLQEFVIADVARAKSISLDPISCDSQWDKQVIGVQAIQEYFAALVEADEQGETLVKEDVIRLGLWYESEGEYKKALDFYSKYYMQQELARLKELLAILPKELSNLKIDKKTG